MRGRRALEAKSQRGSAKSGVLLFVALPLTTVVAWHLYAATLIRAEVERRLPVERGQASLSVNPFSDVVTIRFTKPPELSEGERGPLGALGAAIGSVLGGALTKAIEPAIERDLNIRARELFDVYALLLPYRVKVEIGDFAEEA